MGEAFVDTVKQRYKLGHRRGRCEICCNYNHPPLNPARRSPETK